MQRREFCTAAVLGSAMVAWPGVGRRAFGAETPASGGADVPAVKLSGAPTTLPAAAIKDFAANFRGTVLTPSDAEYDQARRLWNKMIDRRPAVIARCSGAADVTRAVAFARERELLVAVRGGGHSFPGYSMCNGGLVIDLSPMRGVRVNPAGKTARVAPGSWIGDLDWEAQQYGLATPMGSVSNTGTAGLTLGGGYGWLSRRYGLACDNLIGADLITADARLMRVSAEENPDLLWAIRGSGGNFGVVTSFEYQLHQVGPRVLGGSLSYAPANTRAALEYYAEFARRAPRELSVWLDWGGGEGEDGDLSMNVCYIGDPRDGDRLLQPLRAAVKSREDTIKLKDYVQVQRELDGPPLSSHNIYVKSGFVSDITPAFIDTLLHDAGVGPLIGIELLQCGGAIADVAPTATAIAHRQELYQLIVLAAWKDSNDNEANRARIHASWDKLKGYTSGFYVNLDTSDQKTIEDNYGPNRLRLAGLKKNYDPINLFRMNANVRPAS